MFVERGDSCTVRLTGKGIVVVIALATPSVA